MTGSRVSRYGLRFAVLGYLTLLLALPVGLIFYRTFQHGIGPAWDALTTPEARRAFWLTVKVAAIAVPLNTVFGVGMAIVLVRHRFRGSGFVNALIDIPIAVSPVVVGLSLFFLYGPDGWFGGHNILFNVKAMVLATMFVSLPFVAREVVPVLREIGTEQEQAASTLGAGAWTTFRRITLPSIRWAVAYGVVLTSARALGEFGAVSVVAGSHLTLPLYVRDQYDGFNLTGAYAASALLAVMALVVLIAMTVLKPKETS
jgi:sulfate/thiosulfate transport system permease protein